MIEKAACKNLAPSLPAILMIAMIAGRYTGGAACD
jgi:hypothetical protein